MAKIDNLVTFVKEQVGVQEKLAKKYEEDSYRQGLHLKTANNFSDLAKFLEGIQRRGTRDTAYLNRGDTPQKRIQITYEEIADAPEELLRELNLTENDRQELLVEYIIARDGGILSLDKIMVELYKQTKEVPKRNALTQRLYRMASRGMIYNVPGKKGVYSTYELTESEAKKMFGQDGDSTEEPQSSQTPPTQAPPPSKASASSPFKTEISAHKDRIRRNFLRGAAAVNLPYGPHE
jgi:hypothetical protein